MTPGSSLPKPFHVIPAIDLRDGKCVRLHQGDYSQQTTYSDDPVTMAQKWEDLGALRLHVVDLDGAREGSPQNLEIAGQIAQAINIPADFGGGVRSIETARQVIEAGFRQFSIGTRALEADFASEVFDEFGEAAIADIAAKDGIVSVGGWQQVSELKSADLAHRLISLGCRRIIFTDITRDGTLTGPNIPAIQDLAQQVDIPIIASGGVGTLTDLLELCRLRGLGIEGVIVGKALYDGRVDLPEALEALARECGAA
jgi:phosphoribosylformimino-5-aminoimidazole carboxamide ribotide isomerase